MCEEGSFPSFSLYLSDCTGQPLTNAFLYCFENMKGIRASFLHFIPMPSGRLAT